MNNKTKPCKVIHNLMYEMFGYGIACGIIIGAGIIITVLKLTT